MAWKGMKESIGDALECLSPRVYSLSSFTRLLDSLFCGPSTVKAFSKVSRIAFESSPLILLGESSDWTDGCPPFIARRISALVVSL